VSVAVIWLLAFVR